jgi:hypothetical protein
MFPLLNLSLESCVENVSISLVFNQLYHLNFICILILIESRMHKTNMNNHFGQDFTSEFRRLALSSQPVENIEFSATHVEA